jgi:HD-GYP domain-containing protein (c-di-GMP phosphodiesterase class II)
MRIGEPLPFGVRDQSGKLLLSAGHVVTDERLMQALLRRGIYADVDELRAHEARRLKQAGERRHTLFDLWKMATERLHKLLDSVKTNKAFGRQCEEFALQLMQLVKRDPDVAIYLSIRQEDEKLNVYSLTHSLHTAKICYLMGARLEWPEKRIQTLVQAALTMNISMVELHNQLAQADRITEKHRQEVRRHPHQSVEILMQAGVTDKEWLQAVSQHHERPGGQGYPLGLQEIDELGFALGLADVFMAKISRNEHRAALPIQEAARQMFKESSGSPLAAAIIKEYGIYPPGDFVQLASGEQAVVIRRSAIAHTPVAAAITDPTGKPTVTTLRRDTAQPAYAIVGKAEDKKQMLSRLPPERVFGLV